MPSTRRLFLGSMLATVAAHRVARAQSFPTHPVAIATPYSAGGGADAMIRAASARMAKGLGVPVVIENRPGASGILAAQLVARNRPADGHTIFFGGTGHYALNPLLLKKLAYEPSELMPVTTAGQLPFVLLVNPRVVSARNYQELLDLSKQSPEGLSFGSVGVGTQPHLMMLLLARQTGLRLKPIAYKGGVPAMQDLLGGHVQLSALDLGTVSSQLQAGKLHAIAVSSPRRVPAFPELATLSESGVPGFSVTGWYGLAVRAGTPAPIIDRLAKAYAAAIADTGVNRKIAENYIQPEASTPQEFGALIRTETERYGKLIQEADIKIEE